MKAVLCRRRTPEQEAIFEDVELADPEPPRGHDLLVRVKACGINPLDLKRRAARPVQDQLGAVFGWDAAGVVEAVGSEVRHYRPGDEVFYAGASDRPGCQSELHIVDERIVGPKPSNLTFAAAASLPMAAITASEALFDHLALETSRRGTLLVVGGSGSVASLAIQLARCLTRVQIVATASRSESAAWVRDMGAHYIVDHHRPLTPQLAELDIDAVEWILSTHTTPPAWSHYAKLIAPFGHICLVDHPHALDFALMKPRSAAIHWQSMFTRTGGTADMERQREYLSRCSALVTSGAIKALAGKCFPRVDAHCVAAAHLLQASGRVIGRIVLNGFQSERRTRRAHSG